jgi:hypothetical protein
MAVWKLSPQYKKSAVEQMFFYNDGKVIPQWLTPGQNLC